MTDQDLNGSAIADEPPGEFLTLDELSAYLRIPKNTIYHWRTRGQGPEAHRVGKHLRFYKPDVIAWLRAQSSGRA